MDSVGQRRMAELHGGRRDRLVVAPNLWAGVGLVRGGAGTALVGTPDQIAERIREYQAVGIDTIIGSGYPHLEEAYRVAELLFPTLGLGTGAPQGRRQASPTNSRSATMARAGCRPRRERVLARARPRTASAGCCRSRSSSAGKRPSRAGVIAAERAAGAVARSPRRSGGCSLSGELVRNIGVSTRTRPCRLRHRRLDRLCARPRQRPVGAERAA